MSVPLMSADRWGERLIRRLGLWSAVAVLVGSTIGSGIFRTPASVAQRIDDVPLFLFAWVLGAIVVLCGALTYSELAAAFPRSGGVYVFVRESFGRLPAFLFSWAELWDILLRKFLGASCHSAPPWGCRRSCWRWSRFSGLTTAGPIWRSSAVRCSSRRRRCRAHC